VISGVGLFALATFAAVRFRRKAQNCDVKDEEPCDGGVCIVPHETSV
jgi:hypothetical protein